MEINSEKGISGLTIDALDAFKLLNVKHLLPPRTIVNVEGRVTAVSELVRINKDCVFLVQLANRITIVIRQPQFHKWHQQLVIGQSFVFTNLRPTSLSKVYRDQQRVYVPWTGSKVLTRDVDRFQLSCVSLQEWLETSGLSLPGNALGEYDEVSEADDVPVDNSLTTYQGVVTDVSQAKVGIFELDRTVRLCLCFLPVLKYQIHLHLGDLVTVHNVHQSRPSLTQQKHLFCCMRSSVTILHKDKGAADSRSKFRPESREAALTPTLPLLAQFAFTQDDLQPLLQLYEHLSQVLGTQTSPRVREKKVLNEVVKQLLNSVLRPPEGRQPRNYLLEFCQHQLLCPLSHTQDELVEEIPRLCLLKDVVSAVLLAANDASPPPSCDTTDTSRDDINIWRYHRDSVAEEDGKPVLGWLTVDSVTGRLQLVDSQSAADIVICDPSVTSPSQRHYCSSSCLHHHLPKGKPLSCPHIHPCCLRHLLYVKQYTVVVETFCRDSDSNERGLSQKIVYLLLSTHDCILTQWTRSTAVFEDSKGETENSDSKHVGAVSKKCMLVGGGGVQSSSSLVYITNKNSLKRQTALQFSAEGFMVNFKDCQTGKASISSATSDVKELSCWNQTSPKQTMDVDSNSSYRKGNTPDSHQNDTCLPKPSPAAIVDLGQPVSLVFKDRHCVWFDLIHCPGLYRFDSETDRAPLAWPHVDKKLERAMEKTGTQTTVVVSPDAVLQRVFDVDTSHLQEQTKLNVTSLQSALSNSSICQLWSFQGIVTRRSHPPSQLPDVRSRSRWLGVSKTSGTSAGTLSSLLGTNSLCVTVRDIHDPSVSVGIYFSLFSLNYSLGLLPGTLVEFRSLDKKISKTNRTYFSFLPVSTLHVLNPHHSATPQSMQSARTVDQSTSWANTPVKLLVELWSKPCPADVFVAACHLCQFFSISLKSLCSRCGSLYLSSGCSAPACSGSHLSRVLTRISVLVEDGSSQVLVNAKHCPNDVARKLLMMSQERWQHLENAVQQQGEVFLRKFGQRGGTAVENLLSLLCDSNKVKRPCWLMLRKPASYCHKYQAQAPSTDAAPAIQALTVQNLVQRKINTGEMTVETLAMPYLQLDCLDIREM